MSDILSLFHVLHPHLSMTQVRQFSCVVVGMLAMTGRVSMRNLSRWTSKPTLVRKSNPPLRDANGETSKGESEPKQDGG